MRNAFLFLLLTVLFCLCGSSLQAVEDGYIPPPEKQLEKWYEQHLEGKGPLLDKTQHEFWSFMLGAALHAKFEKNELGMDPFFFAQDTEIKDLNFRRIQTGQESDALVLVTFTNFGKRIELIASMRISDHGWRLLNIVKPDDGQTLI